MMQMITAPDGVRIAVHEFNPTGKKTVCLLPGAPFSHKMYEYQIGLLIRQKYRVIAIDFRGFGDSDAFAYSFSYDQLAQDIYSVILELKLSDVILVGYSMGGAVALRYMRRFRGYGVKKLVLLAAAAPSLVQRPWLPVGYTKESMNRIIDRIAHDRPDLCEKFTGLLFENSHSDAFLGWLTELALKASGIAARQAAITMRDEDNRGDLEWVRVPTRILHGEKDRIVPLEMARALSRGIRGAVLLTLDHSGHGIFYDELDRFNQYFIQALEE